MVSAVIQQKRHFKTQVKSKLLWLREIYFQLKTCAQGFMGYRQTKSTSHATYLSLRNLYFLTNGFFNDSVTWVLKVTHPFFKPLKPSGSLGIKNIDVLKQATRDLKNRAFWIFPEKVSKGVCLELKDFVLRVPSIPRGVEPVRKLVISRENPESYIYDLDPQDIFENSEIQKILQNKDLLSLAQSYVGPTAMLRNVSMWWSNSSYAAKNLSHAAQAYHTDLDTIHWVNFFIYLNDINPKNGPHLLIEGTHRWKPKQFLVDTRISDEDVESYYDKTKFHEFCMPQGSVLAEDTKALHKGKSLEEGERFMLQLSFATTAFGADFQKVNVTDEFSPDFLKFIKEHRGIFYPLVNC